MSFNEYNNLIEKIIKNLLKLPGYSLYSEFDETFQFKQKTGFILGKSIRVYEQYLGESFPQLYKPSIFLDIDDKFSVRSGATEWDRELGMVKAKGEFLERLSTSFPLDEVLKSNFDLTFLRNLKDESISVKSVLGFRKKEINLAGVYYRVPVSIKDQKLKRQSTTSGSAGHFDYSKALLGAWLELIQRDAFLVHWLNTISPKKIRVDVSLLSDGGDLKKTIKELDKYMLEYYFLDITTDIAVPACACVVVSASPTGKRMSLGASAGFDGEALLASAAHEALVVLNGYYGADHVQLSAEYIPFKDPNLDRDARLSLYLSDHISDKWNFLIASPKEIQLKEFCSLQNTLQDLQNDTSAQLAYLKSVFKEFYKLNPNYDVYSYEIKNKLLSEFGYTVVRVLCDGLYPLYLKENFADPDHPRLKEFVERCGLQEYAKLNIWPHPFP